MAVVDSKEYTWAVLYLIGCAESPFVKAPVVADTFLAAQAIVGLSDTDRFVNCNGSVAHDVHAQYKPFMFCGPEYFAHLSNIVDLTNWFYNYVRTVVDPNMGRETAYALCTSIFPAMTRKDSALHVLLSRDEVKYLMNSPKPVTDIEPIRFNPHEVMEETVVKYVYIIIKLIGRH